VLIEGRKYFSNISSKTQNQLYPALCMVYATSKTPWRCNLIIAARAAPRTRQVQYLVSAPFLGTHYFTTNKYRNTAIYRKIVLIEGRNIFSNISSKTQNQVYPALCTVYATKQSNSAML